MTDCYVWEELRQRDGESQALIPYDFCSWNGNRYLSYSVGFTPAEAKEIFKSGKLRMAGGGGALITNHRPNSSLDLMRRDFGYSLFGYEQAHLFLANLIQIPGFRYTTQRRADGVETVKLTADIYEVEVHPATGMILDATKG